MFTAIIQVIPQRDIYPGHLLVIYSPLFSAVWILQFYWHISAWHPLLSPHPLVDSIYMTYGSNSMIYNYTPYNIRPPTKRNEVGFKINVKTAWKSHFESNRPELPAFPLIPQHSALQTKRFHDVISWAWHSQSAHLTIRDVPFIMKIRNLLNNKFYRRVDIFSLRRWLNASEFCFVLHGCLPVFQHFYISSHFFTTRCLHVWITFLISQTP